MLLSHWSLLQLCKYDALYLILIVLNKLVIVLGDQHVISIDEIQLLAFNNKGM